MIDQIYRKTVLTVAGNKAVESVMRSRGWGLAQRFVAGHQADDIIQAVKDLQKDGIGGLLDLLGEFVDSPDTANAFAEQILSLVDQAAAAGIQPYITVKLSGLGQGLTVDGEDLGLTNARRILSRAKPHGGFLALDMEDHPRVDVTLAQFRRLVEEFGHHYVGTVLQSYLHRTEKDLADLADLKPNLRIVKGAYLEPESVAMQDKADINASYRRLVYANLKAGNYTNVASHDDGIIDDVKMFVLAHGIPRDQFEFQLLYGVRRDLQKQLASEGYRVRAYIPYGDDWYPYFSRRIAERPSNALFVLRGMFGG
ncbi:proline dehydrogenase [Deinococcus psychrotolerans]|uniref:proline dehydrogenase n=1 Tax=Deinococcus psychrotolerans TaxID=2489213 RepID=A0A3G8Y8B8_9DEIO|nr:proline dehydrogenase family protein [Deinococcus psychrotolerans]AZI41425.1 proline dehydrogenase [Deinococcus psychrotolerans]